MVAASPRICVVTAGHLATCPRLLKAADTLAARGYDVRVVSARFMDWATEADREIRRDRSGCGSWRWSVVDYHRTSGRRTWLRSGVRTRAARLGVQLAGPSRSPLGLAARAFGRVHPELARAALAEPVDLFYGGTTGGLAAAAAAGRRAGVPYALDLEDFFSGENPGTPAGAWANALAARIERGVLPGAAFLTAGSGAIAAEYRRRYDLDPVPVHNTFPLPDRPPDVTVSPGPGLRLYWFSQTVGLGRGLEDAVRAVGLAGIPAELHLRGRPAQGAREALEALAAQAAPGLRLVHHDPAPPDRMVELCAGYDVGLGVEPGFSRNNELALSNKVFTYLLAGLAVALSGTPGQRALAADLGAGGLFYAPGDIAALAAGLRRWAEDREALAAARAAAWQAAARRWHWEHPQESGALLSCVEGALH